METFEIEHKYKTETLFRAKTNKADVLKYLSSVTNYGLIDCKRLIEKWQQEPDLRNDELKQQVQFLTDKARTDEDTSRNIIEGLKAEKDKLINTLLSITKWSQNKDGKWIYISSTSHFLEVTDFIKQLSTTNI